MNLELDKKGYPSNPKEKARVTPSEKLSEPRKRGSEKRGVVSWGGNTQKWEKH